MLKNTHFLAMVGSDPVFDFRSGFFKVGGEGFVGLSAIHWNLALKLLWAPKNAGKRLILEPLGAFDD
ncbi:MAG: hypothetical protein HQL31_05705 [Planctomycetes bacterium]|nr:hypothetical protein [Planctomycetota bacterium]